MYQIPLSLISFSVYVFIVLNVMTGFFFKQIRVCALVFLKIEVGVLSLYNSKGYFDLSG